MHVRPDNPLIVQGDGKVLVETQHARYEETRDFLGRFAELEASPEHLHTYRINPLSLWNAASAGMNTTEIVDGENFTVSLVKTESEGSGGRLVDDTLNIEVSDLTSILGSLSLGVIKVSGDSHNSLLDSRADVRLSGLFHLGKDESTDLRRRVRLASSFNPGISVGGTGDLVREMLQISLSLGVIESTSNKSLGSIESVFRVLDSLYIVLYNIKIHRKLKGDRTFASLFHPRPELLGYGI